MITKSSIKILVAGDDGFKKMYVTSNGLYLIASDVKVRMLNSKMMRMI